MAEELSKFLLNKYSGKFLISKGLKEILSRNSMNERVWTLNQDGKNKLINKEFKSYLEKIMLNDIFLVHKRKKYRTNLLTRTFSDVKIMKKEN